MVCSPSFLFDQIGTSPHLLFHGFLTDHMFLLLFWSSLRLSRSIKEYKMIGHFLTRGLVMIFGYAYPAYEWNKPEIE
ncbi:hypothetical protein SOVF_174560 [Spinacia oleracea]|nr:hypothetical protein SOVF_174560 [Spinacia oleracea]